MWLLAAPGYDARSKPRLREQTVVSHATDEEGHTQPADLSMKRTRWENNELFLRTIQVS